MDVRIETIGADDRLMEFIDISRVETSEGEFQQIISITIEDDDWLVITIPRHCDARVDGGISRSSILTIISM